MLLALLAFIGAQASFIRAAFPHLSRSAMMRVLEQDTGPLSQTVDTPRLPGGNRRAGPVVGPSVPNAPPATESVVEAKSVSIAASQPLPQSFVPPPPFHPPRAHRA